MIGLPQGYVVDIPYTYGFFRELAPSWLDFIATVSSVAPPDRRDGFHWCEIGCGQGVTTAVLAALHPQGRFVGIDLMSTHIDHGRRLAAAVSAANAEFVAADISAGDLDLPSFDYIVAHGVYAWVDSKTQVAMRHFVDRHLRPGGLVYLSYNAMPGWFADAPFQYLARALAGEARGDSAGRFAAAAQRIRQLVAVGAPSLTSGSFAPYLDDVEARLPGAYLAHEFMTANWRPLYVNEVRTAMATIGLVPAGSATLVDNFDSFRLRRAERDVLAEFADREVHELVRDFLVHRRFRKDVYTRGGDDLSDGERRERLCATRYCLLLPPASIDYQAAVEGAGILTFDNEVARALIAALAAGPRRLADLDAAGIPAEDLLANMLALCCAGIAAPVEDRDVPVATINQAILDRIGQAEEIDILALPFGTAVRVDPAVLRGLGDRKASDRPDQAKWTDFMIGYGAIPHHQ